MAASLIIAGASAAATWYAAHKQGQASERASEQLQQGVREARAYGEPLYADAQRIAREQNDRGQAILADQYQRGQAALAPYAGGGAQGMTALTALLGLPSAPTAAPAGATAGAGGGAAGTLTPAQWAQISPVVGAAGLSAAPGGAMGIAQAADLGRRAATPLASLGRAPATQSSYVSLRAPTGDVRPVPADQVDFYLARGATRV